ncbi:MAG TPA: ABC transporter ATP-binding protein [Candidatus Nanoarchaeia archaeon]|nr:ABC transporter ATP-binding protein [Candidatus Nanoarchaeia archaeon]
MPILTISRLTKRYKSGTTAVDGVSLTVKRGEIFGLLGPNGAGKTTLINCIASLATITSGSISVLGHDVVKDYLQARSLIGLSPQDLRFDIYFSIEEMLVHQAGFYGLRKREAVRRAGQLLRQFGLHELRQKTISFLSGGMKRKLSLAKAAIHQPKLLILDEPTAALDVDARLDLWDYIRKLNQEGTTIILTTHYIEEAEELCDRICILNKGKIIMLDGKKKIMDNLSENVIRFSLDRPLQDRGLLRGFDCHVQDSFVEVHVARKEQHVALRKLLSIFEKHQVRYHNFEIMEDSLEHIFLRLIKDDR